MRRPGVPREIPPPLELECLKTLWTLGEGNVKDVRHVLEPVRSLAYTTVMTVLDRLAHKGVVSRRKVGRSFVYMPAVTRDALRRPAVRELLENFFDGSDQAPDTSALDGFVARAFRARSSDRRARPRDALRVR